ncbi:chromate transporter [Thiospirochaeta perfilievii]|uniref:chromate transporter n=1 Tax=Thiospirochaeta perfilievii TaxID=252967 RepID=UPI001658E200|nr:chromate transporter [Thiospirochaeta perfilievii]
MRVKVPLFDIFITFFKIGLFTLGGGLAMSVVLRHELVLKKKWVSEEDFLFEMSTATLIPGAIAVNLAFLQGRRLRGFIGSFLSVLATILPSIIIILSVVIFAEPYFSNPKVAAFLKGCTLAVTGQLAYGSYVFGKSQLKDYRKIIICAFGIFIVAVLKLFPAWAVLSSGLLGYFLLKDQE